MGRDTPSNGEDRDTISERYNIRKLPKEIEGKGGTIYASLP